MSTTFAPDFRETDIVGYRMVCHASAGVILPIEASWDAAKVAGLAHEADCEDCASMPTYPETVYSEESGQDLGVNVSSFNARTLLEALGITSDEGDEFCGAMGAEDFLGRVLLAQAIAPADEGMPSYTLNRGENVGSAALAAFTGALSSAGAGQGTVVMCGRPQGWLQRVLNELRVLAQHAIAHERYIVWG